MTNKRKSSYSKFGKKDFLFVYLLIALPVLQFAVFWFYVNISSFTLAFKDPAGSWTFDNFRQVWYGLTHADQYGTNILTMILRSFTLWFISNCVVFPIALCTTYVLFRRVFGHYVFRVIYMLPSLIGGVVWIATMKQLLSNYGAVVYFMKKAGASISGSVMSDGLMYDFKTAFPTLCLTVFIYGIAGGNAVVTGAYSRIPEELFDVGKLDGIGFWREFFNVCLPCIWPTVSTLLTFSLCTIFVGEGNVFLYTNGEGGYGLDTMGFYIQYLVYRLSLTSSEKMPYGYPAAIGLFITLITLPIVLVGRRILESLVEAVET